MSELCEICNGREGKSHSYHYGHFEVGYDNSRDIFVWDGTDTIVVCKHCAKNKARQKARNELIISIVLYFFILIWLSSYNLMNSTVVSCLSVLMIGGGVFLFILPEEDDGIRALIKEKAKREGQTIEDR